ncbi:NF038104 family lipoprotein [Acinetobacter sp. MD2(2019)]|uniref:NF038104 family lipoprotein n=1 Tax=Acinetobacter sp. MD2(2019) TaxID=2605273 RepID=UPI002D1F6D56|nr:NF038104 family lipoprotein [Acinetobacter sp. MD2(2019)]MEB3754401.1 NF038104 family lipoprotein [Acinetobacter sp. MD2(2019)]
MTVIIRCIAVLGCLVLLQGCITKIVTVPVKVAYKTTKGVVKGTAAVVRAVTPDGDDHDKKQD